MDKLESLRAFAKVVELGSFSEAGRALRLSRSAVSKYIGELEDELGVQLLNRTTRRVSPTENGQAYFERVLGILGELEAADQAVTQLQATPRGLLRVNAPMSFGTLQLGPAIAELMQLYPELRIQLVLSDENVDPLQDGLDVTLRIADLESSSLIARKIMPIARVICASPDYFGAHGVPSHPNDLRGHNCLTYGFLSTGNQWKLSGKDGDHWIQPSWTLCVNNAEVLRDAAVAGRGITLAWIDRLSCTTRATWQAVAVANQCSPEMNARVKRIVEVSGVSSQCSHGEDHVGIVRLDNTMFEPPGVGEGGIP